MGIKKSRDSTFTVVKSGFQVSKDGIRRAGKYADPMGQGKEEEEQGQDPAQFLPRKLQKKWEKLPEAKKQYYKEQAVRAVRRKAGKKGPAISEEHRSGNGPAICKRGNVSNPWLAQAKR